MRAYVHVKGGGGGGAPCMLSQQQRGGSHSLLCQHMIGNFMLIDARARSPPLHSTYFSDHVKDLDVCQ